MQSDTVKKSIKFQAANLSIYPWIVSFIYWHKLQCGKNLDLLSLILKLHLYGWGILRELSNTGKLKQENWNVLKAPRFGILKCMGNVIEYKHKPWHSASCTKKTNTKEKKHFFTFDFMISN